MQQKLAYPYQREIDMLRAYGGPAHERYLVTDLIDRLSYLVTRNEHEYAIVFVHHGSLVTFKVGLDSDVTEMAHSVAERLRSEGINSVKGVTVSPSGLVEPILSPAPDTAKR